jgi:hypothetical protein
VVINWDAAGAIGEIVGATAVVISVLYLASQVRGQVREAQLAAIHEVSEGFREGIAATFMDPHLSRVFNVGKDDFEGLNPEERIQFIAFLQRNYRVWEDAFYQFQAGRLDEHHWRSMEKQYSALLNWPGVQKVWDLRRDFFTPDFMQYVDTVERHPHPL